MRVDPAVELRGVWRRYRRASGRTSTLRGSIARGPAAWRHEWAWALRDVHVAVDRGGATAVIGANGAGKSTMLRLVGGIGRPDQGTVRVEGRIGAMLDLGREFHPDLTGRQNAELAAVVAGLSRREFRERVGTMLDFAELHEYADEPLHAYSDGMRARLAFSVLAHVEPDVLLVDEVLAVGDAAFQRRSIDRIDLLRSTGTAVLFVSHDLGLVREVCDEAIWLDGGVIRARGDARTVVEAYLTTASGGLDVGPATGGGPIRQVAVCDAWGTATATVRVGDGLLVECEIDADPERERRNVSVVMRRQGAGPSAVDTSTPATDGGERFEVCFERLDLTPGRYDVVVAVFDGEWRDRLGEHHVVIDVVGEGPQRAVLAPPHGWRRRPA